MMESREQSVPDPLPYSQNPKEDSMANNKKVINMGVVLESGPDAEQFNDILTNEEDLQRVIKVRDVDQMLRYFRKLSKDGVKVRKLVLMGHGTDTTQHVGMLKPLDVDLQSVRNFRDLQRFGSPAR